MSDKKWQLIHQPCPCGKSSDAYCIRPDGSGYCFSCGTNFRDNEKDLDKEKEINKKEFKYSSWRGISESTMRFYEIKTKYVDGLPEEQAYKYPSGGFQIRNLQKKDFYTIGSMTKPGLFGKDKFDPGSRDSITISEGALDAASVYEITRGRTASVSVVSASTAHRDCYQDRDYINSFKKIYFCFDADDPGQKALKEVVGLFDFNKVYVVKLTKHKDPNDYLQNNEADDFQKVWENARRYSPDNIISTFAEIKKALSRSDEDQIGTYPFKILNDNTYGLHQGEVIIIKAQRGHGKTEFLRALEYHLLSTTKHNIGLIHLEEDNATTIKALAGYQLGIPCVLPDSGCSNDDIFNAYSELVGGDENRVHLYNSFEMENENAFIDNVRFLVAGAGCKVIFFDHITWLATGGDDQDERKKLDRISQRLKLLAKELKFCVVIVSHVNENGWTRGSRNIENVGNTILSITRDVLNPDENIKRTSHFMLEKVRLGGRTGEAGVGIMDTMTHKLIDPYGIKKAA